MKKVNLRDLYPDVYKTDHFVEVTEDVLETIRDSERAEAAYDRRMYRYKAHYSLDCDNGIENAILMKPQTPEGFHAGGHGGRADTGLSGTLHRQHGLFQTAFQGGAGPHL